MAKSGWNVDQLKDRARNSIHENGKFDGDYNDESTYRRLRQALANAQRPLHYLAIPPSMFATVAEGLAKSECTKDARIMVEKPFGRDLASAQALKRTIHQFFPEPAVCRIDHFLGKEPELVEKHQARPRYRQSLGHNHVSQLLSMGTVDSSVSREILDFIDRIVGR